MNPINNKMCGANHTIRLNKLLPIVSNLSFDSHNVPTFIINDLLTIVPTQNIFICKKMYDCLLQMLVDHSILFK